jgi:glycerol-3-phosphate acyltransferase PlsX
LLEASPLGFVGNVEARDVYRGEVDVIVSDGFTGNVALKVSEGLVETLERLLTEELARSWRSRIGFWLSRASLRRLRRRIDEAEYGGAALLGVAGVCIIGHGRSSARAVRNGIALAAKFVGDGLVARVADELRLAAPPVSASRSAPH